MAAFAFGVSIQNVAIERSLTQPPANIDRGVRAATILLAACTQLLRLADFIRPGVSRFEAENSLGLFVG